MQPFRFAVVREITPPGALFETTRGPGRSAEDERAALLATPQRIEALGYDGFMVGEHLYDSPDPLIDLMATAAVTSTIRLGTTTLINDFHNPALLAKRIASLDLFTGGRVELGIGVGYNPEEFRNCGIPYHEAKVRIARLRESLTIIKALFGDKPVTYHGEHFSVDGLLGLPRPVQDPHPPILVGGGGRVILKLAAEMADMVSILPGSVYPTGLPLDPQALTFHAMQKRVEWVKECAGPRREEIGLGCVLFRVLLGDDRRAAAKQLQAEMDAAYTAHGHSDGFPLSEEELLASPLFALGTTDEICEQLLEHRKTLGLSQFELTAGTAERFAPVVQALRGQ